MKEKKCITCFNMKTINEFYKSKYNKSGYFNICKECTKTNVNRNREIKKDYYQDYNRGYYQKNRSIYLKKTNQYNKNNPDVRYRATKKYVENNREKTRARSKIYNMLKRGEIKKGVCIITGSKKVQAHHYCYKYPDKIVWLRDDIHYRIHWHLKRNRDIKKRNMGKQ